jgi:uncharacterized protein
MANPIALITGATSGIGAAFAHAYASRGHDLILTGRRMEKLQAVAGGCRDRYKVNVEAVSAELTNKDDVAALEQKIRTVGIDVLINNAGFGHTRAFSDDTIESQLAMLDVHVRAMLALTHAAISPMRERRSGTIINVSSLAGFLPIATSALYSSTKAFINVFSESLHMELHDSNIRVQALCPGFTHTDFHEKIDIPQARQKSKGIVRWMEPNEVVGHSLRALDRGVVICIPGFLNRAIYVLVRMLPRRAYYALFSRLSRDALTR